uniref:Lithocholate 6-beta-hydroxylase n=1 Tax=Sarcoptes scabiei TaxID=52283 RepID=A0A834VFS3_SARSC
MFEMIDLLKNFWLVIAIAIGSLLIAYYYHIYTHWKRRGIKSPPIIPFYGNLLSLTIPQAIYLTENYQKYQKLFGVYQGTKPVLCVSDPMIIKRILVQDFNVFRNRFRGFNQERFFRKNLVLIRDHDWKRIRSIISPMFTTSKMRKMEPTIKSCVDSLVNAIKKKVDHKEPIMIRDSTGNFSMDVIVKCAFTIDTKAHGDRTNPFVQNASKFFEFNLFRVLAGFLSPRSLYDFCTDIRLPFYYLKANQFFVDICFHLIKHRKESKDGQYDDLLQLMVNARHGEVDRNEQEEQLDSLYVNLVKDKIEKEKELFKEVIGSKYLSENEMVAQSTILFLTGYETTATTLAHCFYELAMNQDVQQKLYNEIKSVLDDGKPLDYSNVMNLPYLDAVLAETLRRYPPLMFLIREASEDYHIKELDITVEKSNGVLIPVYAIHHDPEYFPDPERFDPERFMQENQHKLVPYTYLPFGCGPRNCIAMRFALTEAKLGIANMIKSFRIVRTAETPNKIKVIQSVILLKTESFQIGMQQR